MMMAILETNELTLHLDALNKKYSYQIPHPIQSTTRRLL